MNIPDLYDIAFSALERRKNPPVRSNPGTVLASLRQKDAHADLRTAEVGTPPIRFWTVRYERGGRTFYDRVEAPSSAAAAIVALARNAGSVCAEAVCEISRAEYDRFSRRSP
jgi:hypothetical protein